MPENSGRKPRAKKEAATGGSSAPVQEVVYRLHTLLHTMRAIERREEALCGLMTEIQRTGSLTARQDEEIRDLLEEMPCHEYGDDVESVRDALAPAILAAAGAGKAG